MTSRWVGLLQARKISVSGRVELRLVSPNAVVTWFVTSFRDPGWPANVAASRSSSCMTFAMNRARLLGEQGGSAVLTRRHFGGLRPDAVAGTCYGQGATNDKACAALPTDQSMGL
jgi:hypothetical protein